MHHLPQLFEGVSNALISSLQGVEVGMEQVK